MTKANFSVHRIVKANRDSGWNDGEFGRRVRQRGFTTHIMRLGFISTTLTLSAMRMTLHQLFHLPGLLINYASFVRSVRPSRIIHTNWHHALLLLPMLNRQRDIYWSHEIVPNKRRFRWVFQAIGKRVAYFVAVSEAAAAALRRIGIPSNRIRVVHNGIRDPADTEALAPKHPAAHIGIVGQVGPWKGHDDLLEAFAIAVGSHGQAELHIFGAGSEEYGRELRDRAKMLRIEKRVFWHGFVADRTQIFRAIDICVVPSRFEEPFGLVAVEAAYFEIPVVATRQGGLTEIVEDGVTGFLVAPASPSEIASRLEQLIENETLPVKMGKQARSRMFAKFGEKRFIDQFQVLLSGREAQL